MQKNEKQEFPNKSSTNFSKYQQSDPLLLLQSRQVVQHMLMLDDWIIMSIYTPSSQTPKKNFFKTKTAQKLTQSKQQQSIYDVSRMVSVLAIRTQRSQLNDKTNKQSGMSDKQLNQEQGKQKISRKPNVGEIKMLHKECRLQNIIEWKNPQKSEDSHKNYKKTNLGISKASSLQRHSFQFQNKKISKQKQFLLLSYTRIELYTISNTNPSSITLNKIFETPFLIPFNVIWLRNQKIQQKFHFSNKTLQEMAQQHHQDNNQYKIAMTGIDRGQTFWSGYYEIQNIKRSVYLFKKFVLCPQKKKVPIRQHKPLESSRRNLRRVQSAENIFYPENRQASFRQAKKKLTSSHYITNESSSAQITVDFESFERKGTFSTTTDRNSYSRISEFKETFPSESTKEQNSTKASLTQLQFDQKLQLFPNLLQQGRGKINFHLRKSKCNPPLQFINHFFIETLVQTLEPDKNLDKSNQNEEKSKVESRKCYQLMLMVCYLNEIVLINAFKRQIVSKVDLQPSTYVISTLSTCNLFGIFSLIVLTKRISMQQKQKDNNLGQTIYQKGRKMIKVTVDVLNQRKLGLGLEQLKISTLYNDEEILSIKSIWQEGIMDEIDEIMLKLESVKEQSLKQSYELDQDGQQEKDDRMAVSIQSHLQEDDPMKELRSWMNIPFEDIKYCVLVLTSSGRMLCFNHMKSTIQEIYPLRDAENRSQRLNVSKIAITKLYICNGDDNDVFRNEFQMKAVVIGCRQILQEGFNRKEEGIQQYGNNGGFSSTASIKELRQIIFRDQESQ